HLSGVLRSPTGGVAPRQRYEVRLRRPDGRIEWRQTLAEETAPDGQGLFQIEVPTRATCATGVWGLDLWNLDAKSVTRSMQVNVEEFVPTRLELNAVASLAHGKDAHPVEASAQRAVQDQAIPQRRSSSADVPPVHLTVDVDAKDFLGHASKGLGVRVLPRWTRVRFESEAYPDFAFMEPASIAKQNFEDREQEGTLNEEGRARFTLHPGSHRTPGLWKMRAAATVTEIGGRSTTHTVRGEIDTAPYHLGFRLRDGVAPVGEDIHVDWRLVPNPELPCAPPSYALRLELMVTEYGMQTVNGRLSWQSRERITEVQRFQIGGNGEAGTLTFRVKESGRYRLIAEELDGEGRALFPLQVGAQQEKVSNPEALELTLDRPRYVPGDRAQLQVRGAFAGQLLVTLENNGVLASRVLAFQPPMATLDFQLPEDLRGGAFFSASLIRGVDPSQTSWLPHRAKGLVRVTTDHAGSKLPLNLAAPERAAPGDRIVVRAESLFLQDAPTAWLPGEVATQEASFRSSPAAANTQVTGPARLYVWAVDTGVLLATSERLPDPHAHYFAQRKIGVSTADSWSRLLPDHMRAESLLHIGGDADAEGAMARRLGALPPTERESSVAWSRAVDLNEYRSAEVELHLPNVRGAVTLRAVLVEGDRYSSCEQRIELATDLQVTATWPRYATAGDSFRVPVKVLNTSANAMSVDIQPWCEGPLMLTPEAPDSPFNLAPDEEKVLWYRAQATGVGPVHARFTGRYAGGDESFEGRFQVRAATALHQEVFVGQIPANTSQSFHPAERFATRDLEVSVEIDAHAPIELRPALRALIDYPHGCLEQTTSRLFALLGAGRLLDEATAADADPEVVRAMITAGIDRLHAMQTRWGGMSYWMGDREPSPWGSAYAGHFLMEARGAGYEVPESLSTPLMDYLTACLNSGEEDLGTQALMCRVLAGFGKPQEAWMVRLLERAPELDMAGRAHLASAWLALGRRDRAEEILIEDTLLGEVAASWSGRITSQTRQQGALLSTLLELDAAHPWVETVAGRLYAARENGRWRSTLEDAAALWALARYQAVQPKVGEYRGVLVTATGERFEFDSKKPFRHTLKGEELTAGAFTLQVEGDRACKVLVVSEGTALEPVAAYDRNLKVRRRWLDVSGEPLAPGTELRVGDLIQVELELEAPNLQPGDRLQNIAIVDALPAGLEIENPRLATGTEILGANGNQADRVEFREDRVVIFASAQHQAATFRYAARATLAGSYKVPPVQASSMYDPGFASLGEPASLNVR
ncbi:MAG: hypothetical protein KDB61_01415, partial [Planctomycetes bacterium]|nr:hypothetical protein [Planctomycetota bacterium]